MAIQFLCPYGHRLKVPDHRAGKKGRCPTCQQRVIVPVPNPIPSGQEKRDWDAAPGDRIELDDPVRAPAEPDPQAEPEEDPFIEELLEDIVATPAGPKPSTRRPASGLIVSELELPPFQEMWVAEPPASEEPPPPGVQSQPQLPSEATIPSVNLPSNLPGAPAPVPPPLPPAPPVMPPEIPSIEGLPKIAASPSVAEPAVGRIARGKPRWVARARPDAIELAYRANPQQVETTYWLAVVLLFVIVFSAAPALGYMRLDQAPRWAQAMLLIAGVQLAYSIWLVIVPDWSTVRIGLWLFGVSAVLYAAGLGLFAMAADGRLPLGLTAARPSAAGWCGANALVLGLLSYACGQVGSTWRRSDFVAWSASRRTA